MRIILIFTSYLIANAPSYYLGAYQRHEKDHSIRGLEPPSGFGQKRIAIAGIRGRTSRARDWQRADKDSCDTLSESTAHALCQAVCRYRAHNEDILAVTLIPM